MAQSDERKYKLTVVCRRKRLLDQSNLCIKFVEDALKGRLIPDDSPRFISSLDVRQEKCKKGEQPETIVHIEVM